MSELLLSELDSPIFVDALRTSTPNEELRAAVSASTIHMLSASETVLDLATILFIDNDEGQTDYIEVPFDDEESWFEE